MKNLIILILYIFVTISMTSAKILHDTPKKKQTKTTNKSVQTATCISACSSHSEDANKNELKVHNHNHYEGEKHHNHEHCIEDANSHEHSHEDHSHKHLEEENHSHDMHEQKEEKQHSHEYEEDCAQSHGDHKHEHFYGETDSHSHGQDSHDEAIEIQNLEVITVKPQNFIKTITTVGTIQISPSNETLITAKTEGIIEFLKKDLVVGKEIKKGKGLFSISSKKIVGDNIEIQFINNKNSYIQSKENCKRAKNLIADNIISRNEFLDRKSQYENDSLSYFILKANYTKRALNIQSDINGKIFQIFVKNGDFVTKGQTLAIINNNCQSYLHVDLPKKYFTKLKEINSGKFQMEYCSKIHTINSHAKLSSGNRITPGSPYLPVIFSLDHAQDLLPGSFTKVWLDLAKISNSIVVPKKAIIEQQGLYYIYVKEGENDYHKTLVEIEYFNAEYAKIASGIHFGDQIVTVGVLELKTLESVGSDSGHHGHNH